MIRASGRALVAKLRARIGKASAASALLTTFWATTGHAEVLESSKWQSRLVVAAAPTSDDSALERQRAETNMDAAGWAERRLRFLEIVDATVTGVRGPVSEDGYAIRKALGLNQTGFSVALVGLDGTVKLLQNEPVPNDVLFATIDAMPMRRRELRQRGRP